MMFSAVLPPLLIFLPLGLAFWGIGAAVAYMLYSLFLALLLLEACLFNHRKIPFASEHIPGKIQAPLLLARFPDRLHPISPDLFQTRPGIAEASPRLRGLFPARRGSVCNAPLPAESQVARRAAGVRRATRARHADPGARLTWSQTGYPSEIKATKESACWN